MVDCIDSDYGIFDSGWLSVAVVFQNTNEPSRIERINSEISEAVIRIF